MKKILVSLLAVFMVCAVWAADCRFTLIPADGGNPLWTFSIREPKSSLLEFV